MTTIAVLHEEAPETRVALVPETVASLVKAGVTVIVQSGAGVGSFAYDEEYRNAGAHVAETVELDTVDVLAHVRPLTAGTINQLRPGAVTVGLDAPLDNPERLAALISNKITSLSFELLPRISRAQSMDVLSSQALVAGYRAVMEAAIRLPRFFPLAMTAAGTVPPARVVVLGVGVAGLQAIATARRLGATVQANDIRTSSAEEVRSVGATFIDLGIGGEGSGGYARELGVDTAKQQQDALAPYVADADVLITTASVPGRQAPRLVTQAMAQAMRPGSVIVDLAAANGGNVEGSEPDQDIAIPAASGDGSVTLVGLSSPPSDLPADASRLFSKNVVNTLELLRKAETDDNGRQQFTWDELVVNFDDEVIDGMCLTHEGVNHREQTAANAAAGGAEPTESTKGS